MRLIDADVLEHNMGIAWGESRITNDDWNLFRKILKETPTVSPDMAQVLAYECGKAERKRGRWREYPIADGMNQCSECGVLYFGESNYCSNCGADMRGEANE